jgi:hypothetical protein
VLPNDLLDHLTRVHAKNRQGRGKEYPASGPTTPRKHARMDY